MKIIERVSEISEALKNISEYKNSDILEAALAENDKEALLEICRESKVPKAYRSSIVNLLLSSDPKKFPVFI